MVIPHQQTNKQELSNERKKRQTKNLFDCVKLQITQKSWRSGSLSNKTCKKQRWIAQHTFRRRRRCHQVWQGVRHCAMSCECFWAKRRLFALWHEPCKCMVSMCDCTLWQQIKTSLCNNCGWENVVRCKCAVYMSNPRLEQNLPCRAHPRAHNLCLTVEQSLRQTARK